MRRRLTAVVSALFLLLLAVATPAQRHVPSSDPERPSLQYDDSSVSLNDRCIVRRAQVNWEFYFFSNAKELSLFHADPLRYSGSVTDPVSRMRFRPAAGSPRAEHGGRPFFFQSEANLALFAATPDSFAVPRPRRGMMQHESK